MKLPLSGAVGASILLVVLAISQRGVPGTVIAAGEPVVLVDAAMTTSDGLCQLFPNDGFNFNNLGVKFAGNDGTYATGCQARRCLSGNNCVNIWIAKDNGFNYQDLAKDHQSAPAIPGLGDQSLIEGGTASASNPLSSEVLIVFRYGPYSVYAVGGAGTSDYVRKTTTSIFEAMKGQTSASQAAPPPPPAQPAQPNTQGSSGRPTPTPDPEKALQQALRVGTSGLSDPAIQSQVKASLDQTSPEDRKDVFGSAAQAAITLLGGGASNDTAKLVHDAYVLAGTPAEGTPSYPAIRSALPIIVKMANKSLSDPSATVALQRLYALLLGLDFQAH